MNAADLIALAERCEAATEADRELDALIALEVGALLGKLASHGPPGWVSISPKHVKASRFYTASLDAAMSLVPEEASWMVSRGMDPDRTSFASITDAGDDPALEPKDCHSFSATPALALTAAALRARAASCDERPQGQDPKGLEAKPASAVAAARRTDAQPSPDPIPPNPNEVES